MESFREAENYRHLITFVNGVKKDDIHETRKKTDKPHGVIVKFNPSKNYLGAGTKIPYKEMIEWIEKMSYFLPEGIKIKVDIFNGLKLKETHNYKARPFVELLDKICDDKDYSDKCEFSGDTDIIEEVRMMEKKGDKDVIIKKKIKKNIRIDIALRYTREPVTFYDSYCNYTNTLEGGVHQDAFENCFCRYMVNKTRATQTDIQKEKYKILWEDVKNGLCAVINLTTGAQVGFVGNAKNKVGNTELTSYLTKLINEGLERFFEKYPKVLNEYILIIKLNAKARVEAQKVKTATQKERMSSLKEHELKNLIRCNNTGKKFKEIFLTEGDSAGGSASNGCDKDTQAFLLFRGIVANPLKCSLSEIMENAEWKTFVNVLRCGIGPTFDINKLYYDRINIFTDSDSDGYGISSGMIVFIYLYMRPLIEAGKVYKVFSPLYRIDDKDHPFVVNKAEMVELYQKKVIKKYKVQLENGHILSKDDMIEFLNDVYDYSTNLERMAKNLGRINKFLVEEVIALLTVSGYVRSRTDHDDFEELFNNQKFIKSFMSRIQKRFPEMTLDSKTQTLKGVVDGKFNIIKVNNRFIKQAEDLIPVYQKYAFMLKVTEKGKDTPMELTIGEFLDQTVKLSAKIITRYKGLGELDADQMFETALDINNRVSIQYTVEDAEKELETFRKLHGNSKKDIVSRKEMMAAYKIRRDDLDN